MASRSAVEPQIRRKTGSFASSLAMVAGRILLLVLLAGMSLTEPGCASGKKKPGAKRKVEPQLVGAITLVNLEGGFVLIDGGTHPPPFPGARLKSRTGAVESAELRVSEIRRHPFTIADIVSGVPNKGDLVFQ
jgi:hypothetical protein